jgi:hypothetical protein
VLTQPPIQWISGALFLQLKRPRREADHSPPSNVEVKNAWNYTSTTPIRRHGVVLSCTGTTLHLHIFYIELCRFSHKETTVKKLDHIINTGYHSDLKLHAKQIYIRGVSKSFRTGRLERELQMVQLSATRCSCIALWVSLLSFATITLRIASQRVTPKVSVHLFYRLSPETFGYTLARWIVR